MLLSLLLTVAISLPSAPCEPMEPLAPDASTASMAEFAGDEYEYWQAEAEAIAAARGLAAEIAALEARIAADSEAMLREYSADPGNPAAPVGSMAAWAIEAYAAEVWREWVLAHKH